MNELNSNGKDRSKGFYLLPNLFTTAGLFAGFYAIVAAMKGLYDYAAVAIFIAMIMDSLDGRVARLTNTQTSFGAEYDSLSDVIAFGIAPALFAYAWALHSLGKLGWLAAFFYVSATAIRLARFNVAVGDEETDKRYFSGLPCPSAAGFITALIWIQLLYHLRGHVFDMVVAIFMVIVAILMMSNIPYRSFKDKDFKNRVPYLLMLFIVLVFVGIAIDPPEVLFVTFTIYVLSGFVSWILKCRKRHR